MNQQLNTNGTELPLNVPCKLEISLKNGMYPQVQILCAETNKQVGGIIYCLKFSYLHAKVTKLQQTYNIIDVRYITTNEEYRYGR